MKGATHSLRLKQIWLPMSESEAELASPDGRKKQEKVLEDLRAMFPRTIGEALQDARVEMDGRFGQVIEVRMKGWILVQFDDGEQVTTRPSLVTRCIEEDTEAFGEDTEAVERSSPDKPCRACMGRHRPHTCPDRFKRPSESHDRNGTAAGRALGKKVRKVLR